MQQNECGLLLASTVLMLNQWWQTELWRSESEKRHEGQRLAVVTIWAAVHA